ncbi:hypothetical protein ABID47_005762 [Paenibacillus favisporus]|uniref:Uncharacterized protein n=1 Tax=Paenibacillus favisporus TaxID=221028 RepID=A0ABV2FBM3_9BACL
MLIFLKYYVKRGLRSFSNIDTSITKYESGCSLTGVGLLFFFAKPGHMLIR